MPRTRRMTTMTLLAVLAASACSNDRSETVTEQCERTREHLIRIELPLADEKREEHARVMRRALGDAFVDHCSHAMTATQRKCVLDASDSQAAMACTRKTGKQAIATEGTK
jgi:hypothetical protein